MDGLRYKTLATPEPFSMKKRGDPVGFLKLGKSQFGLVVNPWDVL